MSEPTNRDATPDVTSDPETVAAFAARLEAYAASLSSRERQVLEVLLLAAMDPIERMRWRRTEDVLNPEEEAVLAALGAALEQGDEDGVRRPDHQGDASL